MFSSATDVLLDACIEEARQRHRASNRNKTRTLFRVRRYSPVRVHTCEMVTFFSQDTRSWRRCCKICLTEFSPSRYFPGSTSSNAAPDTARSYDGSSYYFGNTPRSARGGATPRTGRSINRLTPRAFGHPQNTMMNNSMNNSHGNQPRTDSPTQTGVESALCGVCGDLYNSPSLQPSGRRQHHHQGNNEGRGGGGDVRDAGVTASEEERLKAIREHTMRTSGNVALQPKSAFRGAVIERTEKHNRQQLMSEELSLRESLLESRWKDLQSGNLDVGPLSPTPARSHTPVSSSVFDDSKQQPQQQGYSSPSPPSARSGVRSSSGDRGGATSGSTPRGHSAPRLSAPPLTPRRANFNRLDLSSSTYMMSSPSPSGDDDRGSAEPLPSPIVVPPSTATIVHNSSYNNNNNDNDGGVPSASTILQDDTMMAMMMNNSGTNDGSKRSPPHVESTIRGMTPRGTSSSAGNQYHHRPRRNSGDDDDDDATANRQQQQQHVDPYDQHHHHQRSNSTPPPVPAAAAAAAAAGAASEGGYGGYVGGGGGEDSMLSSATYRWGSLADSMPEIPGSVPRIWGPGEVPVQSFETPGGGGGGGNTSSRMSQQQYSTGRSASRGNLSLKSQVELEEIAARKEIRAEEERTAEFLVEYVLGGTFRVELSPDAMNRSSSRRSRSRKSKKGSRAQSESGSPMSPPSPAAAAAAVG